MPSESNSVVDRETGGGQQYFRACSLSITKALTIDYRLADAAIGRDGRNSRTTAPRARFALSAFLAICSLSSAAAQEKGYRDKNGYFELTPPAGWVMKEFDDPRTKVSLSVPAPVAGQSKAGLTLLAHPISGDINVKLEFASSSNPRP